MNELAYIFHLLFLLYFDTSYLLQLARQFSLATYSIVVAIGVTQGAIIGQAVVERFPRMLSNARLTSILLFLLFAANAVVSVMKFAQPDKITISQIFASQTPSKFASIILQLVGLYAGPVTIIAFSTTILILILLKFTTLKANGRAFVFIIGITMIIITTIVKFSDYKPTSFDIFLYMLYQAGITGGMIWGTRRRLYSNDTRFRYFRERWTGS